MDSIRMRPEVLKYIEASLCNYRAVERFGKDICSQRFTELMSALSRPPAFTTVRINMLVIDGLLACEQLKALLTEQYFVKSRACPTLGMHPQLHDCCVIENYGPFTNISPLKSEVIVDISCGAAVLRGADIYVQGILAASAEMSKGNQVSVYVDNNGLCRKGLTKPFDGPKTFIGNGIAEVSRQEVFASGGNICTGIGVRMTEPLYVAPSLSDLVPHLVFPQNLPSVACVHVLAPQPHDTVLDMCAAPGGKTTHIATLMNNLGRVVALDKSRNKLRKLEENASRWKLSCVEVYGYDSTRAVDVSADCSGAPPYPPQTFDRILLDAPCSGLGQRPVIRNNASLAEVTSYPPLQRRLFEKAVLLLRPGGTLVYSTCTVTVEENECIVAWALETFTCLQLVEQVPHIASPGWPGSTLSDNQMSLLQRFDPSVPQTSDHRYPCDIDTIGFFIAKFVKT